MVLIIAVVVGSPPVGFLSAQPTDTTHCCWWDMDVDKGMDMVVIGC